MTGKRSPGRLPPAPPAAATFLVRIRCREDHAWQGTAEWIEKKETKSFRSALELIRIIDRAEQEGFRVELSGTLPDSP